MIQSTLSSRRYDGIRLKSIRRRRRTRINSKITPKDDERKHSKVYEPNKSYTPIQMISSEFTNSIAYSSSNMFLNTGKSSQQDKTRSQQKMLPLSKATNRSEVFTSAKDNSVLFKRVDPSQRHNRLWKYTLMVIYGILGILLLTALILPSILVSLLAPKSSSQTKLSESLIYGNHCAGISSNSLWQINTSTTITMKLNTSECSFQNIPLYFVTIAGICLHYCLTGYDAIYLPTTKSFQIYARDTCGVMNATQMLSNAPLCGWDVNWMGVLY